MKRAWRVFLLLFLTLFIQRSLRAQRIRVAAAANVQFAIRQLAADFEKSTHYKVELVIESSGKLTAQIGNGAPYDLFVSADTKYPQELFTKGFAADTPAVYARGSLVLWTFRTDIDPAGGPKALLSDKIRKIAIADPALAPYGAAAVELLKKWGIYERLKDKLVYGQSISQVSQYLLSGNADIGITAKSIVLAEEMRGKGKWAGPDPRLYTPISQAAVLLSYGRSHHPEAAAAFYRYLYSSQAASLFLKYGYLVR